MIHHRDATMTTLRCGACSKSARVFTPGPEPDFKLPEGWGCYPEDDYLVEGAEPRVVLCPDHAHLTATVRLIEAVISGQMSAVATVMSGPVGGIAGL